MPVQAWVDEAPIRDALAEVYRRPEFLSAERKTFIEVLSEWMSRWLGEVGDSPPWLDHVVTGVLAAIGALLLARIGVAVWRLLPRPDRAAASAAPQAAEPADASARRNAAREAAARGDYVAAVRALYLYAITRLHAQGRVRFHEAKTGGDYLREVGRAPGGSETFGPFLREVERILFGGRPCGPEVFERIDGLAEAASDASA